jgi:hypothetical protein
MSDAQRSRRNAAECLSAADRCELPYRRPAVAIAEAWLSLARHEEAMNELLAIWSKARAPTSASDTLTVAPWKPTSSSAPGDSWNRRLTCYKAPGVERETLSINNSRL